MTDGRRFDQLARAIGRRSSRRDGLKAFAAAAGAALLGVRGSLPATATTDSCIEPGSACDGTTEPFGCCENAVCLFVAEGEFRCCYPAGSDASCEVDEQCCSGACNEDGRCDAARRRQQSGQESAICFDNDECPHGSTCCSGLCTSLADDRKNCGACGWRCPESDCEIAVCSYGVCALVPATDGLECAGGGCVQDGACQSGVCRGSNVADETPCDDGNNPCTLNGFCASGVCQSVTAPNGSTCATSSECISNGRCFDGACVGEYAAFQTPCSAYGCTKNGYCQHGDCIGVSEPDGTPCENGNVCTGNTVCIQGRCEGEKVRCDEYDPLCGVVTCDPNEEGCRYAWFDDGTICGTGGTCINGDCRAEGVDPCADVECEEGFTCVDGGCCFSDSVCPGIGCCGNFREDRGYSHFCHDDVCCRVHLICGDVCCLDGAEPNSINDVICICGTCQAVGEPCSYGGCPTCADDPDFATLVCVETEDGGNICCPSYRACGNVCCSPTEHCVAETQTCERAFPRKFRNV